MKIQNLTILLLLMVLAAIIYLVSCDEGSRNFNTFEKNYLIVENKITIPPSLSGHGNRLRIIAKNPYKTVRTNHFLTVPEKFCDKTLPLKVVYDGDNFQLFLGQGKKRLELECSLLNLERLLNERYELDFIKIENFHEFARIVYLGDTTPNFAIGFETVPITDKNVEAKKSMKPPVKELMKVARDKPVSVFCEKEVEFPKLPPQGQYYLLLTARGKKKELLLKKIQINNKRFPRKINFSVALLHYFNEQTFKIDCPQATYDIKLRDMKLKFKNFAKPISKNKFYEIAQIYKRIEYPDRNEDISVKIGCEIVLEQGVDVMQKTAK